MNLIGSAEPFMWPSTSIPAASIYSVITSKNVLAELCGKKVSGGGREGGQGRKDRLAKGARERERERERESRTNVCVSQQLTQYRVAATVGFFFLGLGMVVVLNGFFFFFTFFFVCFYVCVSVCVCLCLCVCVCVRVCLCVCSALPLQSIFLLNTHTT